MGGTCCEQYLCLWEIVSEPVQVARRWKCLVNYCVWKVFTNIFFRSSAEEFFCEIRASNKTILERCPWGHCHPLTNYIIHMKHYLLQTRHTHATHNLVLLNYPELIEGDELPDMQRNGSATDVLLSLSTLSNHPPLQSKRRKANATKYTLLLIILRTSGCSRRGLTDCMHAPNMLRPFGSNCVQLFAQDRNMTYP